ncbi:MAG: hypothetical protein ACOCQR_02280 [bacterium]
MNLMKMSSELFDHDVQFEYVIPLVGEFEKNEDLEELYEYGVLDELIREMGIPKRFTDYDEFVQTIVDYNKFGMIAEIHIRQYEYTSENSAKGLISSSVYILYAETYEELLNKALNKAKEQQEKEQLAFTKKQKEEQVKREKQSVN